MKAIDMTKIYGSKTYQGKWVAVEDFETRPKVVAYSSNLKETMKKADQKGFKMPLMMQVPKEVLPIVGPYSIR